MNALIRSILWLGLLTLVGCGGGSSGTRPAQDSPLTMEEWNRLEPHIKFDPDTMERLKKGNPQLQTEERWKEFYQNLLVKGDKP